MKVLRTALFSAFLMICFTNVGYSQILDDPTHEIDLSSTTPRGNSNSSSIEVDVLDATAVAIPNSQYVIVTYNTTTSSNSTGTIREEDDTTVLYTQSVPNSGTMTAVVIMGSFDNIGKHLECEVCDAASNCALRKCIVVTDIENDGGGN